MIKILIIATGIFFIPLLANSQHWQGVQYGLNYPPRCFYADSVDNALYIGGYFYDKGLYKWDGQQLIHYDKQGYFSSIWSIARYKGILYAAGEFIDTISNSTYYFAKWNEAESKWDSLPLKISNVFNLKVINNELYFMGDFWMVDSSPAKGLAKWDGNQWTEIYNLPFAGSGSYIIDDIALYKGELYVSGGFYNDTINNIIKYDGVNWKNVGCGMYGDTWVQKMIVYKNELYVAGLFYKQDGNAGNFIQRWDGYQWKDVGGSVLGLSHTLSDNGQIHDMKIFNEELYVGGVFSYAGGVPAQYIAKWNGTEWCGLGGNFSNRIVALGFYKDTLYVGCGMKVDGDTVNYLAKWYGGNYTDTCGVDNSGIEKTELQDMNISIYPNPASTFVNIEIELKEKQDFIISIYNHIGEKVFEETERNKTGNFSKNVNISGLSSGLYILNVSIQKRVYSKKLIKL